MTRKRAQRRTTAAGLEIDVHNSRMNAVKAGGHVFPARTTSTVGIDPNDVASIAEIPGLTILGPTGASGAQAAPAPAPTGEQTTTPAVTADSTASTDQQHD